MSKGRARYSAHIKEQVRTRYPLCRTTADKEALARELGISSVNKLYNLASRLGVGGSDGEAASAAARDRSRLLIRENPGEVKWTRTALKYLRQEFGRKTIEEIAFHLSHSETAVLFKARELGLRKPVKLWNLEKAAAWLGFSTNELRAREEEGLDIYPLGNRQNQLELEVVTTTSLARWMRIKKVAKELKARDADLFFIKEIEESVEEIAEGEAKFEKCRYLSHGHVCQNPFTEASFGLFCTNTDRQEAGMDPRCTVRTLPLEDLRPEE